LTVGSVNAPIKGNKRACEEKIKRFESRLMKETIVAQATAPGRGGIGILRVSGPKATDVAQAVLGKCPKPRMADYLPFKDADGTVLDQGIALYFKGPNSFTGEDVLELQGHGGQVVLDLLLKRILLIDGIRVARPGAVSEQAFLNDKLAEQMDVLWDNPCNVAGNMGGVCTFWPKPQKADEQGIAKDFNFVLVVEKENYESVRQTFSLNIVSAENVQENFDVTSCHEIKDIFMFEKAPDAMQINPSLS